MAPRRDSMDDSTSIPDVFMHQTMSDSDALPPTPSLLQLLPPVPSTCTRLYLCRHGQTEYNRLHKFQGRGVNTVLNETGRTQARHLAAALHKVPLRVAVSSTLKRARETAAIVTAAHPKLTLVHVTDLEEMSFGVFEGSAHALFDDQVAAIHDRWRDGEFSMRFPSGENPLEVAARGEKALRSLVRDAAPQDHVLAVAHGRFNRIVLAQVLHGSLHRMYDVAQDNTCVNVIDFDHTTGAFSAVLLNYTGHLPQSPAV